MHSKLTRRAAIQWTGAALAMPTAPFEPAILENGRMPFMPKFVDLVRNVTSVTGTGPVTLGAAVSGYTSLTSAVGTGDQFYYCIQGVDRPQEREVGRGTMLSDGRVAREPIAAALTNFSSGSKTIALVTPAEWFTRLDELSATSTAAVASVAALASLPPEAAGSRLLTEEGREGVFLFNAGDHLAEIAADPQRALFIAPDTAPTGAEGAWVRQASGPAICTWFGILPGGTDVGARTQVAIDTLRALTNTSYGYGKGSIGLHFPELNRGHYNMGSTTLDISHTIELSGDNRGGPAGGASVLKWNAGVTGIRTQAHDTTGADGGDGSQQYGFGSAQTTIRNLALVGSFAGTEGEAHAIHLRNKAILKDLYIESWAGDGIFGHAYVASTSHRGNINGTIVENVFVGSCRNGIYFEGADSNAILISQANCTANRRYGMWIKDNIGLTIVGGDCSTNGSVPGFNTKCSHDGKVYYCLPNQESWAADNAPSGTLANNQGWAYLRDGGPAAVQPAWSNGMAIRAGGSVRLEGGSAFNSLFGLYLEGDQPPILAQGHALIASPLAGHAVNFDGSPYGGQLSGDTSSVQVPRNLIVGGEQVAEQRSDSSIVTRGDFYLRRDPSIVYNPILHLDSTGAYATLRFERLGTSWAQIQFYDGNSSLYYQLTGNGAHQFHVAGSSVAAIDTGGIALEPGKSLKIGGSQVVGSRGAAVPDPAGGSTVDAEARATINALLARLRTHGLIEA